MFLFELTQLLDQLVILFVGNFGIVLEVIQVIVAANLLTKPVNCFFAGRLFWQLQTLNELLESHVLQRHGGGEKKPQKQATVCFFYLFSLCDSDVPLWRSRS